MPAAGPRKAALLRGDRVYFGGRQCPKGHDSPRVTATGKCVECERVRSAIKNAASTEYRRDWNIRNAGRRQQQNAERYRKRRANIVQRVIEYQARRMKIDPIFALRRTVRSRIRQALLSIGERKCVGTMEIVGCSPEQFRRHLESQFLAGMTWENRHLWHVDHIVALSSATTAADVLALCHFTNLRPIWARDNLAKGAAQHFLI